MCSESLEADIGPVLAAVGGLVDAVADGDAVARPGFAGAGPDGLRVRRIDGDGADGLHRLSSKTGLKVVPPFTDFHTPPLAAPTKTRQAAVFVDGVTAAMRPLIVAEPMLRAGRPEIVAHRT